MHAPVPFPLIAPGKALAAHVTGERFLARVSSGMGGEVVAAAETAQADSALKWFVSRMYADVPIELIRTGEAPVAVLHGASERFLFGWPVRGGVGFPGPGRLLRTGITLSKGVWQQGRVKYRVYGAR